MNLNDNQLKAVQKTEGPLRIIAGPGSGKTRTIVSKIVHILNEGLARPDEILAISFTNKAANEIKERVKREGGKDMNNIFTYHGWCNYFLRIEHDAIGLGRDFTIIDSSDSKNRISNLIKEYDFAIEKGDAVEAMDKIAREELHVKKLMNSQFSAHVEIAKLWEKYSNLKKTNGQLDFNDLIIEVKNLLTQNEFIREKWSNKYKYIFIDEFQDTNNVQFEIIKSLTNENSNLTVVGDPDQNIYSWRGANINLINNFNKYYPGAETIELNINYRSTPEIVNATNALINNNMDRLEGFECKPSKEFGAMVEFVYKQNENDEAYYIARKIEDIRASGNDLNNVAVIVRSSYKTRILESAFNHRSIPYKIIGAMKFFDRMEVKQTLKFLRFAAKQTNAHLLDVINDPPKKFGPKKVVQTKAAADEAKLTIWEYLKENRNDQPIAIKEWIDYTERMIFLINESKDDVAMTLGEYLEDIGYINKLFDEENRKENIKETLKIIRTYLEKDESKPIAERIIDFYNSIMLSSSSDSETEKGEVNIITAHASKGMEFPWVFLFSFTEGHWPSTKAIENGGIEEERRVAYVAATRAMEHLIITYNEYFNSWSQNPTDRSRFIDELQDKNLYNYNKKAKLSFSKENELSHTDHSIGDTIFHNSFGEGKVLSNDGEFINVEFKDGKIQEILIGHKSYRKLD